MYLLKNILIEDLIVDSENPRLENETINETDSIISLLEDPNIRRKIINLSKDILDHGLNPSDLLIVMDSNENEAKYIVLEGNRRIIAIKLLKNPSPFLQSFSKTQQSELTRNSKEYKKSEIKEVSCYIAKNRKEAEHWLELRHQGQKKGAGIVPWGATESARFRLRQGKKEPHLQIIDYLRDRGALGAINGTKIPITSFKRIIQSRGTRDKLGYEISRGEFIPGKDEEKLTKIFMEIIQDLVTGKIHVKDVYTRNDIDKYLDNIVNISKKESETKLIEKDEIEEPPKPQNEEKIIDINTNEIPISPRRNRNTLIPQEVTLRIIPNRINEIYYELGELPIDRYPNAISVLLRVFIELSVDEFIDKTDSITINIDNKGISLATKLLKVCEYFKNERILGDMQLKPIKRAAQRDNSMGATVTTMNQYIHNPYFKPIQSDLISTWDNFQLFIQEIWIELNKKK